MLQNPVAATWDAITPVFQRSPFALAQAPALQTALVTAALLLVLADAAVRHRALDRLDALLLLWVLATWAFRGRSRTSPTSGAKPRCCRSRSSSHGCHGRSHWCSPPPQPCSLCRWRKLFLDGVLF
jgi:hypothetical protein